MVEAEKEHKFVQELKDLFKRNRIEIMNMGIQGGIYYDFLKDEIVVDDVYIMKSQLNQTAR